MNTDPKIPTPDIVVAGDICIEVIGVPSPALPDASQQDNWRLTGEIRTHYRRGGSLLLADMVSAAANVVDSKIVVAGPILGMPEALRCPEGAPSNLTEAQFERLTRDEVVHSVLRVADVKTAPDAKKDDATFRVSEALGFSGPHGSNEPCLIPESPSTASAQLLVLDDTGNRFRRDGPQWRPLVEALPPAALIVHKLHRTLPLETSAEPASKNTLWTELQRKRADRQIVVLDVADLRKEGAVISHRLSWERAAIDLVSQLRTVPAFKPLAACTWLVVRFGLDGAVVWHQPAEPDPVEPFAWLVYDPQSLEDGFAGTRSGKMVGCGSAFVAGVAASLAAASSKFEVSDGKPPQALVSGIRCGLAATRRLLHFGFGPKSKAGAQFEPHYPGVSLFLPKTKGDDVPKEAESEVFHLIDVPVAAKEWAGWTILKKLLPGGNALETAACELALGDKAPVSLRPVPLAVFGKFSTYDRADAEAYQSISNLIREYLQFEAPKRPLSIAVFGPPGSGKSFGVNEVAESIAGGVVKLEKIVLNLAQFTTPDEIAVQLHLVRDAVLRGKVPLVFFDEFDASVGGTSLFWLKFLLAPMQDGEFLDNGANHPIGKSIFVFAGGTSESYEAFAREPGRQDPDWEQKADLRKKAKLTDFLSRLRGHLDIRGVDHREGYRGPALLRRASVLRFQLKEKHPSLFAADGTLGISPAVLRAFLHVPRFAHGVRSLEAIIDMSPLSGQLRFEAAFLPSESQLAIHVVATTRGRDDLKGPGFLDLVAAPSQWESEAIRDSIAEKIHGNYLAKLAVRDPKKPSHRSWSELDEFYRDSNREQADDIPRKLRLLDLDYRKLGSGIAVQKLADLGKSPYAGKVDSVARDEHDRWVAARRRDGWTYGPTENRSLQTHPDILDWDDPRFPDTSKAKDRSAIQDIPLALAAAQLEVFDPNIK